MGYKLKTMERVLTVGKDAGQVKSYTRIDNQVKVELKEVAEMAAQRCSLSTDVFTVAIAVFTSVIRWNLEQGHVVNLGDLGTFRLTVSSKGMDSPNENKRKAIRKVKVSFRPGKGLKVKSEE